MTPPDGPGCPLPDDGAGNVLLGHGSGGRLMHRLLGDLIRPALGGDTPATDAAVLPDAGGRLAFTTDSFVIRPLVFPGGDIGSLAVHGTVNDLAMSGASPAYLSVSLILEEGLALETLRQLLVSLRTAADACGVCVVTGDTKVVERGKGDGLFINTSGIGRVPDDVDLGPWAIRPGDAVLVSGDLGRHGVAVLTAREALELETTVDSDSASVAGAVTALLEAGIEVHCLRDLTRGGLSSALNELASDCGRRIEVNEADIPVREDVAATCELLGLDPLYVACEGRFVAFVPEAHVERAVGVLQSLEVSAGARRIGRVTDEPGRGVDLVSRIGARRVLDMLAADQLPRIC